MTVVAVIQARLGSQRLPGKVLLPLAPLAPGEEPASVLAWTLARVRRAELVDRVVVAVSDDAADDPLADELARLTSDGEAEVWRGPLHDVLARMHGAAASAGADDVVRVTADCPLVDPAVVDRVVKAHLDGGHDFTANRLPPPHERTWPIGLDVEVVTRAALDRAHAEAREPAEREHVMPYLYATPGRFDVHVVQSEDPSTARWTIDTAQDLDVVRALLRAAEADVTTGWQELLAVWRAHPELAEGNAEVVQKGWADTDQRR